MTLEQLDKIEAAAEKYGDVSLVLIPILKSSLRETLQERDDANDEIERLRSALRMLWEEAQAKAAIRDSTTDAVVAALKGDA